MWKRKKTHSPAATESIIPAATSQPSLSARPGEPNTPKAPMKAEAATTPGEWPPELTGSLGRKKRQAKTVFFPTTGQWLAATPTRLLHLDGVGQLREDPWFEVQSLTWDEDSAILRVYWSDPARSRLELNGPQLEGLSDFGNQVRAWLTSTQVVSVTDQTASGVKLRAAVRKDSAGHLFSEVVAFGPLDQPGHELANELEEQVRDMAGMEPVRQTDRRGQAAPPTTEETSTEENR